MFRSCEASPWGNGGAQTLPKMPIPLRAERWTSALRRRDGIVSRTMYPVIPPRVEYALTPLGATLLDAVGALVSWADAHLAEVDAARAAYDARAAAAARA